MVQYYGLKILQKLASIHFNNTEIPVDIYMNILYNYREHVTALLEYILTALLEYINLLKQFF